ncbi:glycosyltransferase family 4 protein [Paenibacillus sp. HJGM_3]|uniref:glycosyltransferase family 4 protein n=1 Tax=Paenibacillus sp. HJGM_3 TaxID=3379816 RepID=UPI00385BF719
MKIVFLTARFPYPPYKGDQLIAYEQIKRLHNEHEVYLVTLDYDNNYRNCPDEVIALFKGIYVLPRSKFMKLGMFKTLFNFKPLQVNLFYNRKLLKQAHAIMDSIHPDLVQVQTIRMAEYMTKYPTIKILDMIDAISLNMARRAKRDKLFLKPFYFFESFLLKRYEEKAIAAYNRTILVSEKEKEYFNSPRVVVNSNGTSMDCSRSEMEKYPSKEKAFIFHGNMSYFPNVEAMLYFTKEIWPEIHRKYPDYKLYIVGKDPSKEIQNLNNRYNIVVTGFVEDISLYLLKSIIGIYPLNAGTGIQNKVLESLACGLPVICSNYGIQGIAGITNREVFIANSKEEIIQGVEELLLDEKLRQQYSFSGQRFVAERYSWARNVSKLEQIWQEAGQEQYH